MKIVIGDTNIFIDLINIDLLDTFLKFEYEIHTTDFVLNELNDLQIKILEKCINESKILLDKAYADELVEIIKLQSKKRTLSITDMSVYYFAKKTNV